MIVYVVAAAQALAYLAAVPLYLAVRLRAGNGLRVGVGVGAFERRFAEKRALPPTQAPGGRGPDAKAAWRVLRRAGVDAVGLRGRIGLGDAAATALACGALRALAGSLGRRAAVDVAPDFDAPGLRAELQVWVRVRAGRLLLAAARSTFD